MTPAIRESLAESAGRPRLRRMRLVALAARAAAISMLLFMLSGWSVVPKGAIDAATDRFVPSLAARSPRIVRPGDAACLDVEAVLPARDSRDVAATAELVDASGAVIASASLLERDPRVRDRVPEGLRGGRRVRGRIVWRPQSPGAFSGVVRVRGEDRVPPASVSLRVADEPLRIFLLDRPRFESRFLVRSLARDERFDVTTRLFDPGSPSAGVASIPETREDWNRFDVVVIGGVEPASMPEPAAAALVEAAVEDGVGIVWSLDAAGDPEAIAVSPLGRLLPFRGATRHPPFTTGRVVELADAGEEAAWLAMADDAVASREAWRAMPSVYATVVPTVVRPTARVMARCAEAGGLGSPFILADQAGGGRIVAFLSETWRLRQAARGPLVERLLSQSILHAAEPHFASRLGVDAAAGPEPRHDDDPVAGLSGSREEASSPTSRPIWNHPAVLLALVAACGIDWWLRGQIGEGP